MVNSFQHYGVKGMKWGVRKKYYKSSYDKDYTIKKGSSIQNISKSKGVDLSNSRLYGATSKKDKLNYSGFYADQIRDLEGKKAVLNDLRVTKDIKIPSQRKSVEAFMEAYASDPKGMARSIGKAKRDATVLGNLGKSFGMDAESRTVRKFAKKGDEWIKTKGYNELNTYSFVSKSGKYSADKYVKTLMNKGYGGLRDVNDINSYWSDDPVIVFNPKSSLSVKESRTLSKEEIAASIMNYAKEYENDRFYRKMDKIYGEDARKYKK